ncbi:MAG: OadG family transporter subunit [Duncaniella sp.]|nr:OadG family transporter subunit [Duncaniella sp.]
MKKKLFLLLVVVTACVTAVSAQGRRGLRINEVMVVNDSSVVDDFGQHHAWVELYNSTFAPLEISSVFLTNDRDNNKKYPVPLGDINTEIPARQHVLFWADGQPNKGTFHMNFTLTPGEDNYIAIYDANGLSLIDEVVIPASLKPGQSYARKVDGEGGTDDDAWEVRDGSGQYYITPSSNNVIKDTNGKVEMFAEQDENGFGMAVMAMGVVFTALLLLSLCFYIISKIGEAVSRKNKVKTVTAHLDEVHDSHKDHDSGEAIAAIVMALHEHLDAHDRESTVLTINKVRRAYSPWNSKIYSLRELPHR